MGLFGKKRKDCIPLMIRVQYYDGELKEFPCNFPCQITLTEDMFCITKVNPAVEVNLRRDKIVGIDIFDEPQYMAKYKGVAINTSKGGGGKTYYVFHYINKNGENTHLDFWGTFSETLKVEKMKKFLFENQQSKSYEI